MVKQWKRSLSGSDVQDEAEDALEKDISQMSPASNSVAANLDGGVAAVDWSSKTNKYVNERIGVSFPSSGSVDVYSVNGSGYVFYAFLAASDDIVPRFKIDGSIVQEREESVNIDTGFFIFRFDSSVTLILENYTGVSFSSNYKTRLNYVLD